MQLISSKFYISLLILGTLLSGYGESARGETTKRKRQPSESEINPALEGTSNNEGHEEQQITNSDTDKNEIVEPAPIEEENTITVTGKFWLNESMKKEDPTTPNEYPLSMRQVRKHKNITLLHRLLKEDLDRHFNTYYSDSRAKTFVDLWNDELYHVWLEYKDKLDNAANCLYRAKTTWEDTKERLTLSNERNCGLLEQMLENVRKTRHQLLHGALKSAAQIQPWLLNKVWGQADYTDLIELSLSITHTEKAHIFSHADGGQAELRNYLEKMSEKHGVIANPAFASILKRLLCMGKAHLAGVKTTNVEPIRDLSFVKDNTDHLSHLLAKKALVEFLTGNIRMSFEQTGKLLVESSYSRLRHLFQEVVDDEKLQQHYKALLADPDLGYRRSWISKGIFWKKHTTVDWKTLEGLPKKMNCLYDLLKLKYLIAENKNDWLNLPLWKILKAMALDIEFGRDFFFAELLHEKLQILARPSWWEKRRIDIGDIFNDIVRIVLTRGPLDLADINWAYGDPMFYGGPATAHGKGKMMVAHTSTAEVQNKEQLQKSRDLLNSLNSLIETHYPVDSSDAHLTLRACQELVYWAQQNDTEKNREKLPANDNIRGYTRKTREYAHQRK